VSTPPSEQRAIRAAPEGNRRVANPIKAPGFGCRQQGTIRRHINSIHSVMIKVQAANQAAIGNTPLPDIWIGTTYTPFPQKYGLSRSQRGG
jgi:hypothetical protein